MFGCFNCVKSDLMMLAYGSTYIRFALGMLDTIWVLARGVLFTLLAVGVCGRFLVGAFSLDWLHVNLVWVMVVFV